MQHETPTADMIIADLLARWPETARVFLSFGMACVGCVMAPFGTIADAAAIYRVEPTPFLQALQQAAGQPQVNEGLVEGKE